jgi:transposase
MRKSTTNTMGIDLGDRFSHVYAISTETGEILGEKRVRTRVEDFEDLFGGLPPMRVVLETGTHSNWVARLATRHGHETVVAHARRLRLIYENPTKSDEKDARMLAEIGSTHPHLLHPVQVRSEETCAHLAVLRSRDNLVRARTRLVSAARGLTKSLGHRLPACSSESFARRGWDACPKVLEPALRPLLLSIAVLTRHVRAMDREVERLCRERYCREAAAVRQVQGVGPLTTLAFVLVVGDPARFRRNRDVGAYLGLVPRRDQSGSSNPQLPITKCGDAFLRRLLVQSAQYVLGPFGQDSDLRRWGLSRAERGGTNAKRRAVVAVARRLAVLLLSLLRSGAVYEPQRLANRTVA